MNNENIKMSKSLSNDIKNVKDIETKEGFDKIYKVIEELEFRIVKLENKIRNLNQTYL